MSVIELSPNDPRLGRHAGEQVEWPAKDIDGNDYDRRVGIVGTRAVGKDRFVVLTPSFKDEIVLKEEIGIKSTHGKVTDANQ